jgi:hypothetical protein
MHALVRGAPSAEELGVVAVEHAREGGRDGGRSRHARVAMNDDALDLRDVLLHERPDRRGVLPREEDGFREELRRRLRIGE